MNAATLVKIRRAKKLAAEAAKLMEEAEREAAEEEARESAVVKATSPEDHEVVDARIRATLRRKGVAV